MQECNNQSATYGFDTGMLHANARNASNAVNARLQQAGTAMKKHAIYLGTDACTYAQPTRPDAVSCEEHHRACVVNRDSRGRRPDTYL